MADVSGTRGNGRDSLIKMLPTAATMPVSSNSALPASPSGEYSDENVSVLSMFLHRIAGFSELDIDAVVKDHCYAKAWNWKPDNIYVKPVKKLFFSKPPDTISDKGNTDVDVDVEKIEPQDNSTPFDLTRTRHQMEEFQRLANFVRPDDDGNDDWEEKINKMLWLPIHHRVFARVLRVLSAERLARLAKCNIWSEPIFRRTSGDTTAKRFRETLASTGWDWKTIQWLHALLFEHLPRDYLAIYLDILQTLRLKIPQLIDRMIATQPNITGKVGSISWETLGSLLKRPWDPCVTCLNSNRPKKLPGNPILIVAPSSIGANVPSRHHKWISQLGLLGTVVNVHMHVALSASRMTMIACTEQLVQATRAKIQDVRADCPGRPIILVGFNSGAALACQIAQLEHVTAVVCFGFPFTTVEGKRGTPDDTLMDIRCPVMFAIGENASLVRPDDLENVREKMLVETSLVIVGTADDNLRISTSKKLSEGITQSMVDRCILEEIGDFVAGILLQPHPLPPRPFSMTSSSSIVKEKTAKKEPRKRKNSTSSSVDSEINVSPNVKKSRPVTPVSTASNLNPIPVGSRILPHAAQSTVNPGTGIFGNANVSITANNQTPIVPKRKSRASNANRKNNISDRTVSNKQMSQHGSSTSNGGITLNIGSLASLAPIGPIRLAPTVASHSSLATVKSNVDCRSPITLGPKTPKIVQTNATQSTKMKTVSSTSTSNSWTKRFSKFTTSANSANVSLSDKIAETKALNVLNTSTNQISLSASALASHNKSMTNSITGGSLSALLQSGKSALGTVTSSITTGRGIPTTSSSVLLTTCIGNSMTITTTSSSSSSGGGPAVTITATASAKVMDSIASVGGSGDSIKIGNSTMSCSSKKHSHLETSSTEFLTVPNPSENGHNDQTSTKSPLFLPFINKSATTILPMTGRSKTCQRYGNSVPKITINANNLQKSQRGKLQTVQSFRKKNFNDVDDDLGNILDIPIIFAKDGDNLNTIGRDQPPLGQIYCSNNRIADHVETKPKRLGSTTKVVLISNKQQPDRHRGSNQIVSAISNDSGQRGVAQGILHSRSENQPISLGTNWNVGSGLLPVNSATRSNAPTIKYTKIILAKRNVGSSTNPNNSEKNQQIVLTKTATKLSAAKNFSRHSINDRKIGSEIFIETPMGFAREKNNFDNAVEIEDAIKTNIIERKLPMSIPEIDLTSPIKNQQQNQVFHETTATPIMEMEHHVIRQGESDK